MLITVCMCNSQNCLKAGHMSPRTARFIIICIVLGVCVLNAVVAIFSGKQPPEALYGVLGTIGAYVLFKEKNDDEEDPPGNSPGEEGEA